MDAWRQRISLRLGEVQALLESSKFEPRALDRDALQKAAGQAQVASVLLLAAARRGGTPVVDRDLADRLEAEAERLMAGQAPTGADLLAPLVNRTPPSTLAAVGMS